MLLSRHSSLSAFTHCQTSVSCLPRRLHWAMRFLLFISSADVIDKDSLLFFVTISLIFETGGCPSSYTGDESSSRQSSTQDDAIPRKTFPSSWGCTTSVLDSAGHSVCRGRAVLSPKVADANSSAGPVKQHCYTALHLESLTSSEAYNILFPRRPWKCLKHSTLDGRIAWLSVSERFYAALSKCSLPFSGPSTP